jgi:hypothetical protein
MGSVFLASDAAGRLVALKVIRDELADDAEFRRRFRSEVARAREVPPFCTAEVLDADTEHDPPYLVVEYVDGPSLATVVRDRGPLTPANQHGLAVGVAVALTAIHGAGVIHRDLKPSNVLLAPGSPKVIDFGIARGVDNPDDTRTDQVVGTVGYMAPERFAGKSSGPLTAASDIFSWGGVMAFAATGRGPFLGEIPAAIAIRIMTEPPDLDGVTGPLRELVEHSLAKNPADRPTARELLDNLLAGGGSRLAGGALAPVRTTAFPQQPEVLAAAGIQSTGVFPAVPATDPGAVPGSVPGVGIGGVVGAPAVPGPPAVSGPPLGAPAVSGPPLGMPAVSGPSAVSGPAATGPGAPPGAWSSAAGPTAPTARPSTGIPPNLPPAFRPGTAAPGVPPRGTPPGLPRTTNPTAIMPTVRPVPGPPTALIPPVPRRRRGAGVAIALLSLAVIVLGATVAGVATGRLKLPGTATATNSPVTVSSNGPDVHSGQPTPSGSPTPSPTPSPTATATATPTPTPSPSDPTVPSGQLVIDDQFPSGDPYWKASSSASAGGQCTVDGTLAVTLTMAPTVAYKCNGIDDQFTDVAVRVQASIANLGSCATVWLRFTSLTGGYAVKICYDRIQIVAHTTSSTQTPTLMNVYYNGFKEIAPNTSTTVTVTLIGNVMTVYRDGVNLGSLTDTTFTAPGRVVLGVFAYDHDALPPYSATFTRVDVYRPGA